MKFIVCIKQVPDVTSPLQLHDGEISVDAGRMVLNAYDASAVEAALVLSESCGGSVSLVLAGREGGQETLRKALAMGAESAVHLHIDADLDSRVAAELLAEYLREAEVDVIACGKQSQDSDAGLTGSMLSELLGLPFVGNAVGLEVAGERLRVTRQGDAGQEIIEVQTPCIVSCSNDMNDPRIPSLKGIMAAKRTPIDVRPVEVPVDLASPRIRRYEAAPERAPGRVLEGDVADVVRELVHLLDTEANVL